MRSPRPGTILLVGIAAALGLVGLWRFRALNDRAPASLPVARPATAVPPVTYLPEPVGAPVADFGRPLVTHVLVSDLDQDGLADILYSEAQQNTIRWIRQAPRGVFTERILAREIPGPAHVATADVNGTGRLDVLVASMGQITPNNDRIGSVVILENMDNVSFRPRVVLERVARVTDVQAANLSGHRDGRLDLIVAQFGYAQGETRWMRNLGHWRFESHIVNRLSGAIHAPPADYDGDGRTDFALLVSQEWEEVHLFRNLGGSNLQSSILWGSTNEDFGSSGLTVADLNRDGRPDLLYTNGDGFDYTLRGPRPWHGVQWLENLGGGGFLHRRIDQLPGAYAPTAADLNGDSHLDVVAVSGFADWSDPQSASLVAWLNNGRQQFTRVVLARRPIQLVTAAVGDLDGNGVPVIVTGGFHAFEPFEHMSNITLWRRP